MYNLHAHTFLSDGELLPSEVAVRYQAAGYKVIALTDHADYSNIKAVAKAILEFCRKWPKASGIKVLPGIELTHLPPEQFKPLASLARRQGLKIIIAHGETTVEPVVKDTNRLALLSDIDILAHPGLLSDEDARLAAKRGILLEITSRKGHNRTNAHVINQARKFNAGLILNNDSHTCDDIISPEQLKQVGLEAGLTEEELVDIYKNTLKLIEKRRR